MGADAQPQQLAAAGGNVAELGVQPPVGSVGLGGPLAEQLPGIMITNITMLFGYQMAGVAGGILAVLGVLSPAFTLTLAAVFFHKFKDSKVMSYIMRVVKPLCIGMILEVLISLSGNTYLDAGGISWMGIAIGLLCFWLLQKRKMSVPKVIGIAAALGVVGFGVL